MGMEMSMDLKTKTPKPRPLWGTEEVAEYLGVPVKTLYKWRLEKHGPPWLRVGKHLRYVQEDVVAWVEGRKQLAS
jgi:excisionase family DNA binding protein